MNKHYIQFSDYLQDIKEGCVNIVQCPCGSGKTHHIINDILKPMTVEERGKVLVTYPLRVAKAEFDTAEVEQGIKVNHTYMMNFVQQRFNEVKTAVGILPSAPNFYTAYTNHLTDWLNSRGINKIILDEADMLVTQSEAQKNVGAVKISGELQVLIDASVLALITMGVFKEYNCTGFSANPLRFPPGVYTATSLMPDIVNPIVTGLRPNTQVKKVTVYEVAKSVPVQYVKFSLLGYANDNKHTIIYQSRYTKAIQQKLAELQGIQVVLRQANTAVITNENGFTQSIGIDSPNFVAVGQREHRDLLTDSVFDNYNGFAGNMSSTRAVSLTGSYDNATVIVFTNAITTAVTQFVARFRNCPIHLIIVCKDRRILDDTHNVDPYFQETIADAPTTYVTSRYVAHITKWHKQHNYVTTTTIPKRDTQTQTSNDSLSNWLKVAPTGFTPKRAKHKLYCEWFKTTGQPGKRLGLNKFCGLLG